MLIVIQKLNAVFHDSSAYSFLDISKPHAHTKFFIEKEYVLPFSKRE